MADTTSTGNTTPTVDQATPTDTAQSTGETVQLAAAHATVQVSAPARGTDVSITVEPGQTVELKDPVLRFTQDGGDLVIHWANLGETHTTVVGALAAGTPLVLADGTTLSSEQVIAQIEGFDPGAIEVAVAAVEPAAGVVPGAAAGGAFNTPFDNGTLGPPADVTNLLLGTELQFGLLDPAPELAGIVAAASGVPGPVTVCDEARAEFDAAVAAYNAAFPDVKGLNANTDAIEVANGSVNLGGDSSLGFDLFVGDLFVEGTDSIGESISVSNSVSDDNNTFNVFNDLLNNSGSSSDTVLVGDAFLNITDTEASSDSELTVDVTNTVSGGNTNLFNAFADDLRGGSGDDIVVGDAFLIAPSSHENDISVDVSNFVSSGDNNIFNAFNDLLNGGAGNDLVVGDLLTVVGGDDFHEVSVGVSNTVFFGDGNQFNVFDDDLIGGDGDDVLTGDLQMGFGPLFDAFGTTNDDTIQFSADVSNFVEGGSGNSFFAFNDMLDGGAGNDFLVGDISFGGGAENSGILDAEIDVSNTIQGGFYGEGSADNNSFTAFSDMIEGGDDADVLVGDIFVDQERFSSNDLTLDVSNSIDGEGVGADNNSFSVFDDILDGGPGVDLLVGDVFVDKQTNSAMDHTINLSNSVRDGDNNSFSAFNDFLFAGTGAAAEPALFAVNDGNEGFLSIIKIGLDGSVSVAVTNAEIAAAVGTSNFNLGESGVAVDAAGNIFFTTDEVVVGDGDVEFVLVKPASGGPVQVVATDPDVADPEALVVAADGTLYLVDDSTDSILKIADPLGTPVVTVLTPESVLAAAIFAETGNSNLDLDAGIAISADGATLYVTSDSTQNAVFAVDTATGAVNFVVIDDAFIDLLFITVAPDGTVIVIDEGSVVGDDAVYRISSDGSTVTPFLTNTQIFDVLDDAGIALSDSPDLEGGAAFDAAGNFYLIEESTDTILKWDAGATLGTIDTASGAVFVPQADIAAASGGVPALEGDMTFVLLGGDTLVGDYLIRHDDNTDNQNDISIDVSNSVSGGVNNTFDAFGDVLLGGLGNDLLVGDMMLEGQDGAVNGEVDVFIDVSGNGDINLFNDHLCGDAGDDTLYGDFFADDGGSFNITFNGLGYLAFLDTLDSEDFTLTLFEDKLDGASGNDDLIGGFGDDTLIGGLGDDTFLYGVGLEPGPADVIFSTLNSDFISGFGTALDVDLIKLEHGAFSRFFNGSANSLLFNSGEDINAVHVVDVGEGDFIFSTLGGGDVPGVVGFGNEDLLLFDGGTGTFSPFFDGSANGFDGEGPDGINALFVTDVAAGSFVFSPDTDGDLPGVGTIESEDLILFDGAGNYSLFFDGSEHGISSSEDILSLFVTDLGTPGVEGTGSFIFSISGALLPDVGVVPDEDLILFDGATDTYSKFLDGGDDLDINTLDAVHVLSDPAAPDLSTDGNDTILDFGDGDDVVDLDALFDALGASFNTGDAAADAAARAAEVSLDDTSDQGVGGAAIDTVLTVTGQTEFSITFQDVTLTDPTGGALTAADLAALGIDVGS